MSLQFLNARAVKAIFRVFSDKGSLPRNVHQTYPTTVLEYSYYRGHVKDSLTKDKTTETQVWHAGI